MPDAAAAIRARFAISRGRYRENLPILVKPPRETLGLVYADLGFTVGAEIGVRRGEYAEAIFTAHPGLLAYYAVDMWDLQQDQYQRRRGRYLREARKRLAPYPVTFLKERSLAAVLMIPDASLDFVYIDAAHDFDNVVQDLIQWSAKVKPGGIVAGHDYFQHRYGGVVPAVDAYVRCHRIAPWYVTYEVMPSFFWVKP
jgi:hypothetical protein